MMTGCTLTLSRKVNEKAKVKTNIKEQTRAPQTSTRARIVANLDIGRKTAGIPLEERMTIPPVGKGKSKNTGKGKGKHVDVVETEQLQPSETASTVSYPSQDPSVVGELSCISSVDLWIMGVTLNSVSSTRKQAGAEYLFLDMYPGQKIPLPDPGIPHSKWSKITTRRRTTGDIQTSRRTNNQSTFPRVCSAEPNSVSGPSRSTRVLE